MILKNILFLILIPLCITIAIKLVFEFQKYKESSLIESMANTICKNKLTKEGLNDFLTHFENVGDLTKQKLEALIGKNCESRYFNNGWFSEVPFNIVFKVNESFISLNISSCNPLEIHRLFKGIGCKARIQLIGFQTDLIPKEQ